MSSPPKGKSASKSPPILPAEFLAPSPPRATKNSSSDVGVLKLPNQISQNEDRLSKPLSQSREQPSSSESGGSGSRSLSSSELPFLDESPASYPVGDQYTQGSSLSTASQSDPRIPRYTRDLHESESHAVDVFSLQSVGAAENTSDTGISQSHHSANNSYSAQNVSDESGSNKTNNSFGTNTSGSMNSRSSDSQLSDMSFSNNIDTSTPRPTSGRRSSQKSASLDSEKGSSSQPLSPTLRAMKYRQRQMSQETRLGDPGPSQSKPFPVIPENDVLVITDDPSQCTEVFGSDPSHDDIEAAFAAVVEVHKEPSTSQDIIEVRDEEEDVPVVLGTAEESDVVKEESATSQDAIDPVGSAPQLTKIKRRGRSARVSNSLSESSKQIYEYMSSDDEEISRSMQGNGLDLQISQSQANIVVSLPSLPSRSRRTSVNISGVSTPGSTSLASISKDRILPSSSSSSSNTKTTSRDDAPTDPKAAITDEGSTELVSGRQEIPGASSTSDNSSTRQSTPPTSQSGVISPQRRGQPRRSSRPAPLNSQDLFTSQSTNSPHPPPESETDHEFPVTPKRRRVKPVEPSVAQVASYAESQEFWESSETTGPQSQEQGARSRSRSRDISSFPEGIPSDQDFDDQGPSESKFGYESPLEDGPPSPTTRPRLGSSSPSFKVPPSPSTSRIRESRRRGSSQHSEPITPTRRNSRRIHSATEALRMYKVDDAVWAQWRKMYYAGRVARKEHTRYDIRFLDGDINTCTLNEMRPLRLRLGAHVMAQKPEVRDQSAIVEGVHMAADPMQSRVDVRFKDHVEANLPLVDISLTMEMMAELDKDMDWDQETVHFSQQAIPPIAEASTTLSRQSSSVSAAPSTPRKNRGKAPIVERSLSSSSTPSRRGRTDSLQGPIQSTLTRSGKDLFKEMSFVLSLSGFSGNKDLERDVATKIKAGGGTVMDDFSFVVGVQRTGQSSIFLISYSVVRTEKYLEALALNVPRLSYRWIESCSEARQLLPYQSYLLPTGHSKELDTTVSSTPYNDNGVFDGMQIGLCGLTPANRNKWERIVRSAGATTIAITAKSGPKNCGFIVFFSIKAHQQYSASNTAVPSLSEEWIIQCLINQRVVAIKGHPSYTDLEKKGPTASSFPSFPGGGAGALFPSTT
ncbi:hypothetical protein BGZ65_002587 [Modicella reniformis]|uniref:BRCT domain-containing protein n=1 Tax=Modicella reniformis TaxID=1440133 RepID=A0A9P6M9M2_9FUNG|nr:hypothetical protein BGZ65_002587 [Modicella reniformis]